MEPHKWVTGEKSMLDHPLFTSDILLPTHPVEELVANVKRAVMCRETGFCLVAPSGVGKSSGLIMVEHQIKNIFPNIAVFRHDTHNHQIPSIRAFFMHFLLTVGHFDLKGETFLLRCRLVNALIDSGRLNGSNVVLLLIDEAHAMSEQDLNFLKDVYNDLAKENVQLISVLMGQDPELRWLLAKLESDRRLDLIGRFAMRIVPFRPFNSLIDLQRILSEIDSARYPSENGPTWTEFFFPLAFENGFRLVNEADRFYNAMSPADGITDFEFPARQTFLAIRNILYQYYGLDCTGMVIPKDAWPEAVKYSKVKEAIQLMRPPASGSSSYTT